VIISGRSLRFFQKRTAKTAKASEITAVFAIFEAVAVKLMKIAKRITVGYVVLILLPAVLLFVQVIALRRLQAVNQSNSGENLRLALTAVGLVRDRDEVEEQVRRYLALGEPAAKDELKESMQSFESSLQQILEHHGTEREQAEANRLAQFWKEFNEVLSKKEPSAPIRGSAEGFPADLVEQLERLRAQSLTVFDVGIQEMKKQAGDARKSSARAELVSWWIGGAALVIGALLALLTVRSISIPLRNLSEGARGIAEGKSFYRLDTSREDELGQIAKDINTLAETLRGKTGIAGEGGGEH
jgi:methyl-accepting chemotaxis protein